MKHLHIIGLLVMLSAAGCAEGTAQHEPQTTSTDTDVAQESQTVDDDEWHLTCAKLEECIDLWANAVTRLLVHEGERTGRQPATLTIGISDWLYPENDPGTHLSVLVDTDRLETLGWDRVSALIGSALPGVTVQRAPDIGKAFVAYAALNRNGGLQTDTHGFPGSVQHLDYVVATTVASYGQRNAIREGDTFVFRVSLIPGGASATEHDYDYHSFANFWYAFDRGSTWVPQFHRHTISFRDLVAGYHVWVPFGRVPIASTAPPSPECGDVRTELAQRIQPDAAPDASWVPTPEQWEAVEEYARDAYLDARRMRCALAVYTMESIVFVDLIPIAQGVVVDIASLVDASPAVHTFVAFYAPSPSYPTYWIEASIYQLIAGESTHQLSPRAQQALRTLVLPAEDHHTTYERSQHGADCDCLARRTRDRRDACTCDPNAHDLAVTVDIYPASVIRGVPLTGHRGAITKVKLLLEHQAVAWYYHLDVRSSID